MNVEQMELALSKNTENLYVQTGMNDQLIMVVSELEKEVTFAEGAGFWDFFNSREEVVRWVKVLKATKLLIVAVDAALENYNCEWFNFVGMTSGVPTSVIVEPDGEEGDTFLYSVSRANLLEFNRLLKVGQDIEYASDAIFYDLAEIKVVKEIL